MNAKMRFYSAIVSGIVGAIVAVLVTSISPLIAQEESTNMGDITCNSLRVVDSEGHDLATIGLTDGDIICTSLDVIDRPPEPGWSDKFQLGRVSISHSEYGGAIRVLDANGKHQAAIVVNERGAIMHINHILVLDKLHMLEDEHTYRMLISSNDYGGILHLFNHKGEETAQMAISKTNGKGFFLPVD